MSTALTKIGVCPYIRPMKQLNDMATAIRLPSDLVAEIDAERRDEKDIPSRAEMIRRLLADALHLRRAKRRK